MDDVIERGSGAATSTLHLHERDKVRKVSVRIGTCNEIHHLVRLQQLRLQSLRHTA
jgi:hypothetical protein